MRAVNTILIVDDDRGTREILRILLQSPHYHLSFAKDGDEALTLATRIVPDLILLDVMMPGMSGFEVCSKIRATPLLSEVPILLITALNDSNSRLRGLELGADDFITKPFDYAELQARVHTITKLNRYRRLLTQRIWFEWVVDQSNDGFVIVDCHGHILYLNRKARIYLNISACSGDPPILPQNETFLQIARRYYHCETKEAWETWHHDLNAETDSSPCISSTSLPRYLVRPETKRTRELWLRVDQLDIPMGSHVERLIRLNDVTEQMTKERTIRTFQKLISHKLRSPLGALTNSIHLLTENREQLTPEMAREFIEIASQSIERLRCQVDDVLLYLKTPDLVQREQGCELSVVKKLVTQICEELEVVSLTILCPDELNGCRLYLSQQAIELLLREVIENTRKFHPTQSPCVEVCISCPEQAKVSLVVRDDGTSLTPEQITEAWVPYYQAEKYFSGEVPGMGLGLAMVAMVLWSVGGCYHIANRYPGPGVEVELVVPLKQEEPDQKPIVLKAD
jgi:DNA-binding response OmpR family regulator